MAKLVDVETLDFSDIENFGWIDDIPVDYLKKYLMDKPAVDAVPVIRCKDCEYSCACMCKYRVVCLKDGRVKKTDDFCSYGERREENG